MRIHRFIAFRMLWRIESPWAWGCIEDRSPSGTGGDQSVLSRTRLMPHEFVCIYIYIYIVCVYMTYRYCTYLIYIYMYISICVSENVSCTLTVHAFHESPTILFARGRTNQSIHKTRGYHPSNGQILVPDSHCSVTT